MSLWGGRMYLWQKNDAICDWLIWKCCLEVDEICDNICPERWLSWAGGDVTWMSRRVTWRWGRRGKPHASTQSTFCLDNPNDHHPLIRPSWSPGHHPLLSLPASKCSQSYGSQPQQLSLMLLSAGYYRRLAPRSWSTLWADRAAANTRRPASPPFPSLAGSTTQDLTTQEFSHYPPPSPLPQFALHSLSQGPQGTDGKILGKWILTNCCLCQPPRPRQIQEYPCLSYEFHRGKAPNKTKCFLLTHPETQI